jgi:hypothetical protein
VRSGNNLCVFSFSIADHLMADIPRGPRSSRPRE